MMRIYDEEGNLTGEAQAHFYEWMESQEVIHACCRTPSVAAFPTLQAWPDVAGEPAKVNAGRALPVVLTGCTNCGQIRSYLASRVFPDWMAANG